MSDKIKPSSELLRINRDTKIATILKREFKEIARNEMGNDFRLLFVGSGEKYGLNVASLVEGWEGPEGFAEFVADTGAEVDFLNAHGFEANKIDLEHHLAKKASDVVLVLDDEIEATDKFLKNVKRKGFLICRGEMAIEAMESGDFDQKGVLTIVGGEWTYTESREYDVVQTDEEFKKAKSPGAVSYKEARETLIKLGKPTDNVFEEYQNLIKEAREKQEDGSVEENGDERLFYTDANGTKIEIKGLPRKRVSDEDVYILRKHSNAL